MCELAKNKQQGSTLLVVLMLLLVMMVLALSVAANSTSHAITTNNSVLKKQAYQAAISGSDVLLKLLNTDANVVTSLRGNLCSSGFTNQFSTYGSGDSKVVDTNDIDSSDKRGITSVWYACVPASGGTAANVVCGSSSSDCIAVVITGVACPSGADITVESTRKGCVVSRHLQTYAVTNSN
ncbi:hypothetical protein MTZ49_06750 [Entomomonas sp. E2T0]|uniref:hypothetical protein n=1 Tax=Entomomonas sp. E2T0 TaxID=2930213 RepID=UPI00222831C7|nr:hypothetical protein [Entomomonas sp. E2T0]UYZ85239.1 hypothetical protein MTZ49_06750 [Entomomonas sp. E2T0]